MIRLTRNGKVMGVSTALQASAFLKNGWKIAEEKAVNKDVAVPGTAIPESEELPAVENEQAVENEPEKKRRGRKPAQK